MVDFGLLGAMGRMGGSVRTAAEGLPSMHLAGIADREDDPTELFQTCDVVIDFTSPGHTAGFAAIAAATGTAYVVGTTGLTDTDHQTLNKAAERIAVVQAGNFSLGVNLLMALARRGAAALGQDFDVEILEMHHRYKVDAPSGTALMLGEAVADGLGVDLSNMQCRKRDGVTGERPVGQIGFASLRGGSVVGEHSVIFAGGSETITLSHRAEDRSLFAEGALAAARFAATAPAGRYSMEDVLGLEN